MSKEFDVHCPGESHDGRTILKFQSICDRSLPPEVFTSFGGYESLARMAIFYDRVQACAVADWLMENGWELRMGRHYLTSAE